METNSYIGILRLRPICMLLCCICGLIETLQQHSFGSCDRYGKACDVSAHSWNRSEFVLASQTNFHSVGHRSVLMNDGRTGVVSVEIPAAIAIWWGHDASIAISKGGRVQCVLELERLFEDRYMETQVRSWQYSTQESASRFFQDWVTALEAVRNHCPSDGSESFSHFEDGVIVEFGWSSHIPWAKYVKSLPSIVESVFVVRRWRTVHHHEAHALMAFYSSPFRSALVFSSDGAGVNAYMGSGFEVRHLRNLNREYGKSYDFFASLLDEITHFGLPTMDVCFDLLRRPSDDYVYFLPRVKLSHAGKLLGYAATGTMNLEIYELVRVAFERAVGQTKSIPVSIAHHFCGSQQEQRELAHAAQAAFEFVALDKLMWLLDFSGLSKRVDGIVLTGGCALNVLANQRIYDTLTHAGYNKSAAGATSPPLDMYVPSSPNDAGLSVGGLWAVAPPFRDTAQPLQYIGFELWDKDILDEQARKWGAKSLLALGGVDYLADLLAGGMAWTRDVGHTRDKPIIAIVRGRQEFGPRALGHRSLVAVPDTDAMRDRMNKLKFREWYRPVAPMIASEALEQVFGRVVRSPYMTMAPKVTDDISQKFPALVHLDGSARHQSVDVSDEPWIHSLLQAVGKRTGLAALINTSFNSRGKPIVNTVRGCLDMLNELRELDYVLIEDWLFKAPAIASSVKNAVEISSRM